MGAAHSKKRRKERKRRKWAGPDLSMPRSASVDVIRSLHAVSPCCGPCQGKGLSSRRTFSAPLDPGEIGSSMGYPSGVTQGSWAGRGHSAMMRTFSDTLSGPCLYHQHCCVDRQNVGRQFFVDSPSDYDVGDEEGDQYGEESESSLRRPQGESFLRPLDDRRETLETSTMSLNRGMTGRQYSIVPSRSSDFQQVQSSRYTGDTTAHRLDLQTADNAGVSPSEDQHYSHSVQDRRVPIATVPPHVVKSDHRTAVTTSFSTSLVTSPECQFDLTVNPRLGSVEPTHQNSESNNPTKADASGKISLLEDEPSRLARWEKRKLMAQQLRMLRKHIESQENSSLSPVIPRTLLESRNTPAVHTFDTAVTTNAPQMTPSPNNNTAVKSNSSQSSINHIKSQRSKFSKLSNYRYLDNHPLLSKLQNEQNNRLESMERRMKEIKLSAMQEAERRRFAEIFPAKEDNAKAERLMREARETLQLLKDEKKKKQNPTRNLSKPYNNVSSSPPSTIEENTRMKSVDDPPSDNGDIIPVHVVPAPESCDWTIPGEGRAQHSQSHSPKQLKLTHHQVEEKNDWLNEMWPHINLGQPFTWLLLPFLIFPLVLRMLLVLIINHNNANNSATTSPSISATTTTDLSSNIAVSNNDAFDTRAVSVPEKKTRSESGSGRRAKV